MSGGTLKPRLRKDETPKCWENRRPEEKVLQEVPVRNVLSLIRGWGYEQLLFRSQSFLEPVWSLPRGRGTVDPQTRFWSSDPGWTRRSTWTEGPGGGKVPDPNLRWVTVKHNAPRQTSPVRVTGDEVPHSESRPLASRPL